MLCYFLLYSRVNQLYMIIHQLHIHASQVALVVKNPPTSEGRRKRHGFDPWIGKIPWRRAWQPTPVFLPEEAPPGERSLAGCSPWGCKELDMTE